MKREQLFSHKCKVLCYCVRRKQPQKRRAPDECVSARQLNTNVMISGEKNVTPASEERTSESKSKCK